MHATVLPPTDQDLAHAKAVWDSCRTGTGWDVMVDLGALESIDEPIALFHASDLGLTLAVHASGLLWAIENGVVFFSKDGVRRTDHPDPIGLFLAAQQPQSEPPPRSGKRLPLAPRAVALRGHAVERQLLARSGGAQAWDAADIHPGEAQDTVDALLESWCLGMADPFWLPQMPEPPGRLWEDDRLGVLAAGCTQAVLASGAVDQAVVFCSPTPEDFTITTDSLATINPHMRWAGEVVRHLVPEDARTGGVWEYHDGSPTRASSYQLTNVEALRVDPHAHSQHARMQAIHTVHHALMAQGPDGADLWHQRPT